MACDSIQARRAFPTATLSTTTQVDVSLWDWSSSTALKHFLNEQVEIRLASGHEIGAETGRRDAVPPPVFTRDTL
jgi:hypothetical protein